MLYIGDPTAAINLALDELVSTVTAPRAHPAALAVDPRHRGLVHFTLWAADSVPEGDTGTRFRVPALNSPGLADLEAGRHW